MSNESKRINFFIGINTMHEYLEKYVVDQSISKDAIYFDCAFTVDIIEGPHRLFYRGSEEQLELRVDTRNSLYQVDEQESRKKASVTINGEGEGAVSADGDFQGVVNIYVSFCTHFASYLREKGAFEEYHDLDPERQGVLVEMNDGDIELKLVSGKERPNLVCETLTGEMQLMRPYESDFMKSTLIGMMPLEMKERAAESGDTDMMNHLFEYYMGHVETPQNDLNSMMKLMKALKAASGEEDELPDLEKEENTRNPEKAFYWLKKLAESGDAGAMNALSIFYTKAFGKERDFKAAAEWRKKAAENGYEAAEGQENVLLMIAETEEKAKSGDTDAQVTYAKALALLAQENPELGEENDRVEAFQWAKKSASKYNLEGIFTLASFYDNGTGTTKDAVKAFRLFERAANKGHAPSQARLGMMYFQGEGTQENPEAAFEWSKRAAEAGDANGMSNLAACYLLGKGVEQDQGKAVEWLQKAAELGDEGAKGLLEKLGVSLKSQQQPRTLEEAVKAAEQGSVPAMKMLAQYYINRPGGKDDLHEAYKWAKMAADQGDEESNQLCVQLEDFLSGKSKFVPFEETKSNAEAGDAGAQKILADYYATGYETERDLVKALYWMRKAAASGDARFADHAKGFVDSFSDIEEIVSRAEQGDPQAQAQLAEKYVGISQNYPNYEQEKGQRDAFEMAKKSASAGDPLGMFVLGMCYENGYGTEADFDRAFELYKESAELGNPRGELSLSQCYLTGRGTQIDADATMEWLEKAEAHGNPEAEQVRGLYRQLMPMVAMDKLGDGANSGGTDPVQGARLMERAAELGSAEAQGFLGMMYINGNHVENDFETGILWLQKAAENGNQQAAGALDKYDRPEAYNAAANMEFAKKELADKEKVFRLMKHAAEGGLAISQNTLGLLYMNAVGVNPDYNTAMEWFQKAADQGNENAIQNIRKYRTPDGMYFGAIAKFTVNRKMGITDSTDAFELLEKAANAGSPEGLNMLGVFYADPKGIATQFGVTCEEDLEKAKSLFEKALSLKPDLVHAEKNLTKLADLKEAKETGREPNAELKWQIALKKMNAGTNVQTAEAGSPSNRESKQDGEAASEEDHIPEGQTETDASVTNEPQAESASEQKIITEPDETSDSEDEIERELWTAAEANRIAAFGKVGETVCFGRYIQEKQDSPEDIEWIVLDTDGDRSLLISRYALDSLAFQEGGTDGTWETSSLRKWLNEDFLRTAFSEAELKAVAETDTSEGDAQTTDRVFLFSGKEISDVSPFDTRRICRAAPYAAFRGAHVDEAGNCWWWLRSPGRNPGEALAVDAQGEIRSVDADNQDCAVRPAIWIQREHLSSLTKADLSSYGEEEEEQETEQGVRETLYRIKDTFDVDNPESEMHQQSAEIDTPLISSRNKKIRTIAIALIILAMAVSACSGLKLF